MSGSWDKTVRLCDVFEQKGEHWSDILLGRKQVGIKPVCSSNSSTASSSSSFSFSTSYNFLLSFSLSCLSSSCHPACHVCDHHMKMLGKPTSQEKVRKKLCLLLLQNTLVLCPPHMPVNKVGFLPITKM